MKIKYEIVDTKAMPFGDLYVTSEFLKQPSNRRLCEIGYKQLRKFRHNGPSDKVSLLKLLYELLESDARALSFSPAAFVSV